MYSYSPSSGSALSKAIVKSLEGLDLNGMVCLCNVEVAWLYG